MGIISNARGKRAVGAAAIYLVLVSAATPAVIPNLTGLPTYPHLDKAAMDDTWRTENRGRWCARFTATTSDPWGTVADWYRRTLRQASETDLTRDPRFGIYPRLSGIKLALNTDYVAVYQLPDQPTVIELHRCGTGR
jgi:hypothetical protein